MTDEQLVAHYLSTGDADSFRTLVVRHQQQVFRLAASLLGPFRDAHAEDIAQDAFIEAHNHLDQFRGGARFSTWLYRIVWNRAADIRERARFRLAHLPIEELTPLATASLTPLDEAEAAQTRAHVASILEALPDRPRTLLYLYYWMDSSIEEIAALLDMPPGTVKSYLARARHQFQQQFEKAYAR